MGLTARMVLPVSALALLTPIVISHTFQQHLYAYHLYLQDPAAFIHRVGRTARMGRSGSALALLTPNEAHYVEFLKLRKVNMSQGTLRAGEAVQLSAVWPLAVDVRSTVSAVQSPTCTTWTFSSCVRST